MFIYLIIALILLVFSFFEILTRETNETNVSIFHIICCFTPLLLLVSLRAVGFDLDNYENAFDQLSFSKNLDFFTDLDFEPGYILLNVLSPSFSFLILFIGLITLLLKFKFIVNNSVFPIVSLLILYLAYLLNFEMGQIRQALAMSITMFSTQYLPNKKKFISFVVIATLFHYSALIFLLVLLIPSKIKKWYFYFSLIILAVVFYFILEPYVLKLADYLPAFSGSKLLFYYDDEKGQVGISISLLLLKSVLLILSYLLRNSITSLNNEMYVRVFNIYFLSLFIYISFAFFPQISGRGGVYFGIFEVLLIPIILRAINDFTYRLLFFIFIVSVYFVIFMSFLNKWEWEFIPYKTWIL